MKALTLIPKQVKKDYGIKKYKEGLDVNSPSYVNIDFDERFNVKKTPCTISIQNSKCIVNLFRNTKMMHVTIYK